MVASRCEIAYGGMGAVGFLYQSAKDQCKWNGLKPKEHIHNIMGIGKYLVMDDKTFAKANRDQEQSIDELSSMLLNAFGNGKQ